MNKSFCWPCGFVLKVKTYLCIAEGQIVVEGQAFAVALLNVQILSLSY